MQLTSAQCRAQEAIQQDRAENELLDNVRNVARRAAIAWGHEAVSAEKREGRKSRNLVIEEMRSLQAQRGDDEEVRPFSENPDRGFAQS